MVMNTALKWDVYMSGALSALSEEDYLYATTQIYDRVDNICKSISLRCYLPHKSQTTPNKGMPHSKVWEIDHQRVVQSGAIVAYIGIPACGVGAEVEMARRENVPVILLFESSRQQALPQLLLGNPQVKYMICFDKPEDIDAQLRAYLNSIFNERKPAALGKKPLLQSAVKHQPSIEQMASKTIYNSGSLSMLSKENSKYEPNLICMRVDDVCRELRLEYVPDETQTLLRTGTPREIWKNVRDLIARSGVVVADVSKADCNVGAEIEMAHTANVPVILFLEASKQEELSRLILGNPQIKYAIPFFTPADIGKQLKTDLVLILSNRYLEAAAYFDNWPFRTWYEKHNGIVDLEQMEQKGVRFRDFPKLPVSVKEWSESVREQDKSNTKNKRTIKPNLRLDDFV